jgi:hypothetical protein
MAGPDPALGGKTLARPQTKTAANTMDLHRVPLPPS